MNNSHRRFMLLVLGFLTLITSLYASPVFAGESCTYSISGAISTKDVVGQADDNPAYPDGILPLENLPLELF